MDYKQLFDHNPNPCWIFDLDTLHFLAVNRAAVEKYGYDESTFLNMNIYNLRPEEDATQLEERLRVMDPDGIYSDVWRHKCKDGQVFYVRVFSQHTEYNGRKARFVTAIDVDRKIRLERHNRVLNELVIEQKQQLEDILKYVSGAIWICDVKDYRIRFINGACEDIFGFRQDEIIGKAGWMTGNTHPEDQAKVLQTLQELLSNGSAALRFRIYHKNGSVRHILHHCTVQKDAAGVPVSITGVSTDVSAEEAAREQLAASAEKTEELLESITDAFFALDKDWNFTYVNEQCTVWYPFTKDQVLGRNFWTVFLAAQKLQFHEALRTAMTERITVEFEEFSPTAGKWLAVKAYPTREGLSVFMRDITETKKLQDILRQEQQIVTAIINNTSDVVWSIDHDFKLNYFNQGYALMIETWSGCKPAIGENTGAYARDAADRNTWHSYYLRAFAGESFKVEAEYQIGDASHFIDTRFYPVRDTDGSVIGVSCNSRDVTEYRRHIKLVEEQNRKLKEIAWIQSHKVRSPLATLLGLINLYEKDNSNAHTNEEILEQIRQSALSLDKIVQEVVSNTQ